MKKYYSLFLLVGFLITACGGNGGGQAASIVGSWQEKTLGMSTKLSSDGKFTSISGGKVAKGTYRVEGDKIFSKDDGATTEDSVNFELSGDTLKIKDTKGNVVATFSRISDESFSALLPK